MNSVPKQTMGSVQNQTMDLVPNQTMGSVPNQTMDSVPNQAMHLGYHVFIFTRIYVCNVYQLMRYFTTILQTRECAIWMKRLYHVNDLFIIHYSFSFIPVLSASDIWILRFPKKKIFWIRWFPVTSCRSPSCWQGSQSTRPCPRRTLHPVVQCVCCTWKYVYVRNIWSWHFQRLCRFSLDLMECMHKGYPKKEFVKRFFKISRKKRFSDWPLYQGSSWLPCPSWWPAPRETRPPRQSCPTLRFGQGFAESAFFCRIIRHALPDIAG